MSKGVVRVMEITEDKSKLVICGETDFKTVAEFSDHTSTITGLLEFNKRLISCGIDKNIVIYDIIETKKKATKQQRSKSLFSCFMSIN